MGEYNPPTGGIYLLIFCIFSNIPKLPNGTKLSIFCKTLILPIPDNLDLKLLKKEPEEKGTPEAFLPQK